MLPPFHKLTDGHVADNCALLAAAGVSDAPSTVDCLMRLRQQSGRLGNGHSSAQQRTVPVWFRTLKRVLRESPRPDVVLNTLDQFVRNARAPLNPLLLFEQSPRSLDLLARLACGSPFLTQILLTDPAALETLVSRRRTAEIKARDEFLEEANVSIADAPHVTEKLTALRRYQKSELLRIGTCDAFGLLDLKAVTLQISLLADSMVQLCLQLACDQYSVAKPPFSVLALGKHGGEELNYSSDIDLVLIGTHDSSTALKVARAMVDGLANNLATGFLYRVDMRLRPWGDAGPLVSTPEAYHRYFLEDAELWERQALLKARVVAGDPQPGTRLLSSIAPRLCSASPDDVRDSIQGMKGRIEAGLKRTGKLKTEVKLGAGSIRDIEFFVQSLQLVHGRSHPELLSPNTLDVLVRVTEAGLIDAAIYRQLREGYIFLRTIEHALQLLHNQQTHELPGDAQALEGLARRLDYPDGPTLLRRFEEHRQAVRQVFETHFQADREPSTATADLLSHRGQPQMATTAVDPSAEADATLLSKQQVRIDEIFQDIQQGCLVRVLAVTSPGDHEPRVHPSRERRLIIGSHDIPGLLSVICGVLFSECLDIRRGEVTSGFACSRDRRYVSADRFLAVLHIQAQTGAADDAIDPERLELRIADLLSRLLLGDADGVREELVEMFCRRLRLLSAVDESAVDLQITIDGQQHYGPTVIEIAGHDTFGFLFELSNALAVCRFRILRAEIETRGSQVRDRLHVAEFDGSPIDGVRRLEELRTAVTLIKQFTRWLPSNSDPHQALLRFRDLLRKLLRESQWTDEVASLSQPEVLQAVGRVLGVSRYLWEDFLQVHLEDLLPMLTHADELQRRVGRHELMQELAQLLVTARSPMSELNAFKDRHLFRIDLRHVLGHCRPFGAFSEEITELAEVVVSAASRMAWEELVAKHGSPDTDDGRVCDFTLAALGKFGGVEMGFASDIEFVLVFAAHGRTSGAKAVSAATFFERLVTRMTDIIAARRAGIFQIDLRMRPYGQAGSAAMQVDEFCRYYSADGDAWPYERQTLVKLRCLPADSHFSQRVHDACCAAIYAPGVFDFDAMRGMREKQTRQLVRGGTTNAKLSDGGLVDLEYAVQALQLTFGGSIRELQTPNTLAALVVARQHRLIPDNIYADAVDAYIFLRELIDCLRMVRGNAFDLTVPAAGTSDYQHLARRMQMVHDSQIPLDRLEKQMQLVKQFAATVEDVCRNR